MLSARPDRRADGRDRTERSGCGRAGRARPRDRSPARRHVRAEIRVVGPHPGRFLRLAARGHGRDNRVLYSGMPTFIDESGDTGPFGRGGKPYFRLAAVWVPSLDEAERFRESVRALRIRSRRCPSGWRCSERFRESVRALRIQPGMWGNRELKFAATHSHPEWRVAFLRTALAREFRFAVSLFDKRADPYWEQASHAEFLWAAATELAALLRPVYLLAQATNAKPLKEPVFLDHNSDRKFLATVKKQFRGLESDIPGRSSLIGAVAFHGGSVGALIDERDATWYSLIADRDLESRSLT
jgi:hypothetical protein